MWTYRSNYMGPMMHWYETNNIPFVEIETYSSFFKKEIKYKHYEQYAGGRIDCHCSNIEDPDYDHYGQELGLPIMEAESYANFSQFLDTIRTSTLLTTRELVELYQLRFETLNIWEEY